MDMMEKEWWDRHYEDAEKWWALTPRINRRLRQEHFNDMYDYLYNENGRLLDVGCGTGWLSLKLARDRMEVVGIDVSPKNLEVARNRADSEGIHNVNFRCVDLRELETDTWAYKFDSILVYAVLHHLPDNLENMLLKIRELSTGGTHIYIYEPITYGNSTILSIIWILPFTLLRRLIYSIGFLLQSSDGPELSPEEKALNPNELERLLRKYFIVEDIQHWHMMSLSFATMLLGLKEGLQKFLIPLISPILFIEKRLLKERFFREKTSSWILTSYKCLNQGG